MLKKNLISTGEVLFGDVLTDRSGDVLAIHPGTFWFGDVLTGQWHPSGRGTNTISNVKVRQKLDTFFTNHGQLDRV